MQQNAKLSQIYILLLDYIKERAEQKHRILPVEVETKFIDSIKLICRSGWFVNSSDFYEMLDTLEAVNNYSDQFYYFLLYFCDLMKFDRSKLLEYFQSNGADTKMVEKRLKTLGRVMSESPKRFKSLLPQI